MSSERANQSSRGIKADALLFSTVCRTELTKSFTTNFYSLNSVSLAGISKRKDKFTDDIQFYEIRVDKRNSCMISPTFPTFQLVPAPLWAGLGVAPTEHRRGMG